MVLSPSPILVVSSDEAYRRTMAEAFRASDIQVVEASTPSGARGILGERDVAMIVADWSFFGNDVTATCTRLRIAHPKLVIVLHSERSDVQSQVDGYAHGVDDYWPKPQSFDLLIAKSRALLRRCSQEAMIEQPLVLGRARIDLLRRTITRGSVVHTLSEKEYGILCVLRLEHGSPVRRETLMARVWGTDVMSNSRTVDNYILALRRKIEVHHGNPKYLLTVPGIGYRLVEP
ncbi:MAG: response regulator transcription factor [Candidatus Kapabacteria bacterium]|nr:response regulator transcription factor [Candidatus Kapabacteria bacterium]